MLEPLQFEFMQRAILAGILVSIACGIVGTFVVINRIVFISGAIAHAAYGGIGIGYFLRFSPVLGAFFFSIFSALTMGYLQRRFQERADTIIGVMWAVGMAIGIILIDLTPGYKSDLIGYLFGSILTVSSENILMMLILDILIIILLGIFYKEILAISFDETFAILQNIPVERIYLGLMATIALTIVMIMQVVGLIMVIALLSIPAAISNQYVNNVKQMMILASCLGIIFNTIGLGLSYYFNLTSGATIILVAGISYFCSLWMKPIILKVWGSIPYPKDSFRQ